MLWPGLLWLTVFGHGGQSDAAAGKTLCVAQVDYLAADILVG